MKFYITLTFVALRMPTICVLLLRSVSDFQALLRHFAVAAPNHEQTLLHFTYHTHSSSKQLPGFVSEFIRFDSPETKDPDRMF
jgi:hypothetical protein